MVEKYIIGNWKCYKDLGDAKRWLDEFADSYTPRDEVKVILAPTFLCLEGVSSYIVELGLKNVALAAQDISPFPKGAYTGAIAADMVRGMVDYVIVGHSERAILS